MRPKRTANCRVTSKSRKKTKKEKKNRTEKNSGTTMTGMRSLLSTVTENKDRLKMPLGI